MSIYRQTADAVRLDAHKRICSYFALLKKTGQTSLCELKNLAVLPLLIDMRFGDLHAVSTRKGEKIVEKFERTL